MQKLVHAIGQSREQKDLCTVSVVLKRATRTAPISTEPENHNKMVHLRQAKVDKIADYIPELEVLGDKTQTY